MRKIITAVLILFCTAFLLNTTVSAQKTKLKKMKWDTDFCQFEGTYDSKKYTEAQLRNTLDLMYSLYSIPLTTRTSAYEISDIGKFGIAELDEEYKQRIVKLKNLDIVKDDYWEQMRQKQIAVTDRYYTLARLKISGYTNPKILLEADNTGTCRTDYAEPLAVGGDSLLEAWKKLLIIKKSKNGDPEKLQKKYDGQLGSPDKFKFALLDVATFGWWNCVNDTINYTSLDEPVNKNFDRLFVRVKEIYCDEP